MSLQWTKDIHSIFWSNRFWFPDNYTWDVFALKDSGPYKDIYYPQFRDLLVPFPVAGLLLLLRCILHNLVFRPIGKYYKLKEGRLIVPKNIPLLHGHYKRNPRPKYEDIQKLAGKLNWQTRTVERWFRKRRNYDKSSMMKKFCETCWRFTFYFTVHLIGIYILHDEQSVQDTDLAWKDWPHQHVTHEFYTYYMIELGFYWSLLFTIWYDVKRSDYVEHCIHHIITICLMSFSWISNLIRVGVLVLGIHDAVDHWLEIAKLCKYLKYHKVGDVLFIIFAIVWVVTRLIIFPTQIVYPCWINQQSRWPAYSVYIAFLWALQGMHIMWTVALGRGVRRALTKRTVEDVRSASELSEISDVDNGVVTNGYHHKTTNNYCDSFIQDNNYNHKKLN